MPDPDLTRVAAVLTAVFSRPAPPAPAAPVRAVPPTAPLASSPQGPQAEISASQAEKMISWLKADLAAGKISPDAAAKAFGQLGATAEQLAPDTRSDDVKALDQAFPPARPEEFLIRYAAPGQSEEMVRTKEVAAFDTAARAWLSGAEFPRELGNSLVNAIAKVVQATKGFSAAQLDDYGAREFVKLQRAHGPALEERLQAAAVMIDQLEQKQSGLKNLLKSRGIGDSAIVANLLINHSQIFHARNRA